MPEDRSLDDFAEAETAGEAAAETDLDDPEGDAGPDESERDAADEDVPADPAAVDPAVATSTWHADGAACDRCGEPVERRWRDEDEFVCADCASW